MPPMPSASRRKRQTGGVAPPAYLGASPQVQQLYQQYANLPLSKLQQLAAMTPATSAQGQMIRRAMTAKQFAPASTNAFQSPAPVGAAPAAAPPPNARGGQVRRYDNGGAAAPGSGGAVPSSGYGGFWPMGGYSAPSGFGAPGRSGTQPSGINAQGSNNPGPSNLLPYAGGSFAAPGAGAAQQGAAAPGGWPAGFPMAGDVGGQGGFPAMNPAAAPASSASPSYGGTSYARGAYSAMLPMMSFSAGNPGEVGPNWSPGQALLSPSSSITTSPPGFGGTPATPPLQTAAPSGFMPYDQPAPAAPATQILGNEIFQNGQVVGTISGGYRRGGAPRALGGLGADPSPEPMATFDTRRGMGEIYHPGGFLNSPVGGRTDHLPLAVPAESHVIPADVVSGVGQGNSLNGASLLDRMFHSGPWGVKALTSRVPSLMPKPPQAAAPDAPRASGGRPTGGSATGGERTTSILAAGGEYIVRPEAVAEMGRRAKKLHLDLHRKSDLAAGHDAIDNFILRARKKTMAVTRKLPGPVKGRA